MLEGLGAVRGEGVAGEVVRGPGVHVGRKHAVRQVLERVIYWEAAGPAGRQVLENVGSAFVALWQGPHVDRDCPVYV